MKKTLKIFLLLAFFPCFTLSIKGQYAIVLKDSTILTEIKIKDATPLETQNKITYINKDNKEYQLTPKDAMLFRKKKRTYISKSLTLDGITQQLFLERIMTNDSVSLYTYKYKAKREKELVVYEKKGEKLVPLTDTNNPFINYLKTFPIIQQNPHLEEKLADVPPTSYNLIEQYKKIRRNNINLFTRFRWGAMIGGGFSQIKSEGNLSFSNESHVTLGLFADLPIYKYFSFHPEIYYLKNAKLNEQASSIIGMSFNREYINLPLLARFSFINLKSRAIPYVQVGPEIIYLIKGETNGYEIRNATGYETQLTEWDTYFHKNFSMTINAGIGLEYKLNRRHSLFVDIRYRFEPSMQLLDNRKTSMNSVFTTLSFNL